MKGKIISSKNKGKPEFIIETLRIYQSIESEIDELRKFRTVKHVNNFEDIVKSAYVKCYDFVVSLCSSDSYHDYFFRLPALRSMCEDFISLTYLGKKHSKSDINKFIAENSSLSLYESLIIQETFLKKYNPGQIPPSSDLIPDDRRKWVENKPTNKDEALKQGYPILPSVFKMAKYINHLDLYKFLYSSTSKFVHFDPDTLSKMGWGKTPENNIMEGEFSYKHNYQQYVKFSIFYASFLFIHQTTEFCKFINIPEEIKKMAEDLLEKYNQIDWIEITSYEQINLQRPNFLVSGLNRVMVSEKNTSK
jgi:Family of unknown function (DUF5677)